MRDFFNELVFYVVVGAAVFLLLGLAIGVLEWLS